ncbi:hypothetical protein H1Y97_004695 [Escherichia coli]|nr:hypothetical protein [Escherichia coli]
MVKFDLSEGAKWIVDRIPDKDYNYFRAELNNAILRVMEKYGYDREVSSSFDESVVVRVERT